jgi:hypothetical protein
MEIHPNGRVTLEEEETYIQTYVAYHDNRVLIMTPEEALDFMRQQVYETTRSPYLARWTYYVDEGTWNRMEEDWEVPG